MPRHPGIWGGGKQQILPPYPEAYLLYYPTAWILKMEKRNKEGKETDDLKQQSSSYGNAAHEKCFPIICSTYRSMQQPYGFASDLYRSGELHHPGNLGTTPAGVTGCWSSFSMEGSGETGGNDKAAALNGMHHTGWGRVFSALDHSLKKHWATAFLMNPSFSFPFPLPL